MTPRPPREDPRAADPRSVCVVGLGYIGLPTAAVLASAGHRVRGVDADPRVVDAVNAGRPHIREPDLDELVRDVVDAGTLTAAPEPAAADVFFLCVPTPLDAGKKPEMSYVDAAAAAVAPFLKPGDLVVLESTSPPGTTARVAERVRRATGLDEGEVLFVHAPERVLPGKILKEVIENDRILGGLTPAATEAAAGFYASFVLGDLLLTDARSAETVKLVENASRDVGIAFANELSVFCDGQGLDPLEVIRLANRHPRVDILTPGAGVGGHCIAVDPWFLVDADPVNTRLIRTAREINDAKPAHVVEQIRAAVAGIDRPKIACLGLAYKPDVDDLRESPALEIVRGLGSALPTAELRVVEPHLDAHGRLELRRRAGLDLTDLDAALADADAVACLVGHRAFRELSPARLDGLARIDPAGSLASAPAVSAASRGA